MLRSSLLRRVAVATALVAASLMLASTVVASLSLTNSQFLERDLGSFQYAIQAPVGVLPGAAVPVLIADMPAERSSLLLTSQGLRLDEQPDTPANYVEADWANNPLPDRYRLVSGRWPERPGEVAVAAGFGDTVHLFVDLPLTVVGVAMDRFDRRGLLVAAGEGTWSSWRVRDLANRFPNALATPAYFWTGPPEPVLDVLIAGVGRQGVTADVARRSMSGLLFVRERYLAADKANAVERFPLVLGLPVMVIPLLTGCLGGVFTARWSRRITRQLTQVGVGRRQAMTGQMAATVIAGAGGALAGCLGGVAVGWACRSLLDSGSNQPMSPFAVAWGDVTLVLVGVLVGLILGSAPTGAGRALPSVRGGTKIRRTSAGLAGLALISQLPGPDDGFAMSVTYALFALVVALLAPDALAAVSSGAAVAGPAAKLGVAMLEPRQRFAAAVVIILTFTSGLAGGALAIATGQLTKANERLSAPVPAGYAVLRSLQESPPVPGAIRDGFETLVGVADPISVWGADIQDIPRGFQGGTALFESLADIEGWIGRPLTRAESSALQGGAIALPQPATEAVAIPVAGSWINLDSIELRMPDELAANYGGILLEPAVRDLTLPKAFQELFYVGLSAEQEAELPRAAERLGIDPGYVLFHEEPEAYTLPDSFVWSLAALCLVAATLLSSLTTSQAKALRPQLAALAAIGLPRAWVGHVLNTQLWLVSLTSGCLALVMVVAGNAIVWAANPGALTPLADWLALGAVGGITVAGYLVGLPTGLIVLRPVERPQL